MASVREDQDYLHTGHYSEQNQHFDNRSRVTGDMLRTVLTESRAVMPGFTYQL